MSLVTRRQRGDSARRNREGPAAQLRQLQRQLNLRELKLCEPSSRGAARIETPLCGAAAAAPAAFGVCRAPPNLIPAPPLMPLRIPCSVGPLPSAPLPQQPERQIFSGLPYPLFACQIHEACTLAAPAWYRPR